MRARWLAALLALVLALPGCGTRPRQPEWLINADSSQERFIRAYLRGEEREAARELRQFRNAVAHTGQVDLLARVVLTRCAVQVAALEFTQCTGLEPLQPFVPPTEQAYADFLAGTATPAQAALLPEAYRPIAAGTAPAAALARIDEPVSRLIAAGVLLRTGRADAAVLELATATAGEQGWRRAVLAWLRLQLRLAEEAGATEQAARLRLRIAIAASS